jgi:DNA (cytosine-5)-methyltransferase 1
MKAKIKAVDLFCGAGGLTHGLANGGIDVRAGFDIDPDCSFPYSANNKAKFVLKSVSEIEADDLRTYFSGGISLLAGCAPCQPFSTYSRVGRADRGSKDWKLVSEFARLVEQTQPDLVTMENVPQLADHKIFDGFIKRLVGYSVAFEIVDCQDFGIPQTRKRLVLLASRLSTVAPKLERPHDPPVTVKAAIGNLPAIAAGESLASDRIHRASSLSSLNLKRIQASVPGGTWRDWPETLRTTCHLKPTGDTYPSVYGRMSWDVPGPTMTTQCFGYGNGRFGHPEQDRAISLREAAMLQTFPQNYKFVRDDQPVRFARLGKLIGNAVPVRLGEVIALSLVKHVAQVQKK